MPSTPVPPEEETQKGTPRPTRSGYAGATSTKPDKEKHISSAGILTSEAVVIGAGTQITPKIQSDLSVTIPNPAIKCHRNPFINFLAMFTNKQTNKHYRKHTLALALSLDQSGFYQLDNLHE